MFKRISFVKFIETNQIDSCQDKAIIHWDYSKVELSHSFLDAFEEVHKKRQLFFDLFVLCEFLLVNNFQIAFFFLKLFLLFSKKKFVLHLTYLNK